MAPSVFRVLPLWLAVGAAAVIGPLMSLSFTLTGSSYHDDQRALELLCLLVGTAGAVFCLAQGKPMRARFSQLALGLLCLFFTLGLLSSVQAYSVRHALYEWSSFGLLVLVGWRIADEVAQRPDETLDGVLLLCGLGCALYVFKAQLTYIWILQEGVQPNPAEFIIGFNNYRFFNHAQTISLPLLGLLVLRSGQKEAASVRQTMGWWVLLAFWWMLLFVSVGRGTFMGVLAGMAMVLFWRGRQALPWCRVMLWSALLGLVAYAVLYVAVPLLMGLQPFGFLGGVVERSLANPTSSRWDLWGRAGEMVMAHPWLGAGPLHFAHDGRSVGNGAHPHNWVMQIASEWGVPALLCISAVIVMGFRRLLRAGRAVAPNDQKNQAVLTVWLATGIAILVDGLVSGLLVMPTSQLWIVLYIGCAWGWVGAFSNAGQTSQFRCTKAAGIGLSLVLLCMLFFLGQGLGPEIFDLADYDLQQHERYPGIPLGPRIWGVGYF